MARSSLSLVAGRDDPQTWSGFLDWFPDERSCLRYLEALRWPDGFVCPRCGETVCPYQASRNRLICRRWRCESSVTSGTVFDKTRIPLRTWFAGAWYITNQKHGCSALGLQRVLGLGSYQTAWTMLHRLRRSMVRPDRERLHATVEVDESYIGGEARSARHAANPEQKRIPRTTKSVVVMAVETHQPKGFGRIQLGRVEKADGAHVVPFVMDAIEPGSIVHTDGSWVHQTLPDYGYRREVSILSGSDEPAHVSMPAVHRVAALLKRWLLSTHQGGIRANQIDHYLDEFTFRFNRRCAHSRGLLFYRLLEQAVITQPVTYRTIASASNPICSGCWS